MMDQMPFIQQNWQYIVAGFICYLIAKIIYYKVLNSDNVDKERSYNEYKTPDERAEIIEANNEDEEGAFDEHSPSLPKDLKFIPLVFKRMPENEMIEKSGEFYQHLNKRRTVRHFSKDKIPTEVIHNIIKTAGTAPSGAHTEPWTFVVVTDLTTKQQIRDIVEQEEEINYAKRMGVKWTTDLKPLRTDWNKPYLTDAPCIVLVFKQLYSFNSDGSKRLHYYNEMSVALSAGILLAAVHNAGLVSLTSTPLNCGPALRELLNRPTSEKLTLLLPIGYPSEDCQIPDLIRKNLEDILIEI